MVLMRKKYSPAPQPPWKEYTFPPCGYCTWPCDLLWASETWVGMTYIKSQLLLCIAYPLGHSLICSKTSRLHAAAAFSAWVGKWGCVNRPEPNLQPGAELLQLIDLVSPYPNLLLSLFFEILLTCSDISLSLICIFLMAIDVEHLFMSIVLIWHLYIIFRKMSVHVFCPFFIWVVWYIYC